MLGRIGGKRGGAAQLQVLIVRAGLAGCKCLVFAVRPRVAQSIEVRWLGAVVVRGLWC